MTSLPLISDIHKDGPLAIFFEPIYRFFRSYLECANGHRGFLNLGQEGSQRRNFKCNGKHTDGPKCTLNVSFR
jgi:hypothetical protein